MTNERFDEIAAALENTETWMNGTISAADYQEFQAEYTRRFAAALWTAADDAAMLAASDTEGTY